MNTDFIANQKKTHNYSAKWTGSWNLLFVKEVSPEDIEKGPTGCTGYNEPEIMKNTSPLYNARTGTK